MYKAYSQLKTICLNIITLYLAQYSIWMLSPLFYVYMINIYLIIVFNNGFSQLNGIFKILSSMLFTLGHFIPFQKAIWAVVIAVEK